MSHPPRPGHRGGQLTARERDVVAALTRGLSNERIAAELHLSHHTVRNYLSRAYRKLGVTNRVEAATWWATRPTDDRNRR